MKRHCLRAQNRFQAILFGGNRVRLWLVLVSSTDRSMGGKLVCDLGPYGLTLSGTFSAEGSGKENSVFAEVF